MVTIHYGSYGSNLDENRFKPYVVGGPVPGTNIVERGSSDRTPLDLSRSRVVRVPGLLFTAGHSRRWNGNGVAFVDLAEQDGYAFIMRTYELTEQQFADVVTQELNAPDPVRVDIDRVVAQGVAQVAKGGYGTVFHVGDLDGKPILTFSAPYRAADVVHNAPDPAYMARIQDGLINAGMTPAQAKVYVNPWVGSKLGLTVPSHAVVNPTAAHAELTKTASGPAPQVQTHQPDTAPSPLPPWLAEVAAATPSMSEMVRRYERLDPGWDAQGALTNPGGGLTVYRRQRGEEQLLELGKSH